MKLSNLMETFYAGRKLSDVKTIAGQLVTHPAGQRREEWNSNFNCGGLQINSLEGAPLLIHGNFIAAGNYLKTFEGSPEVVKGILNFSDNYFSSLHDIHKHVKEVTDWIDFQENPISSNVLGLLRIKKLKRVLFDDHELTAIINKYLPEGDLIDCQDELMEAGLGAFAKL